MQRLRSIALLTVLVGLGLFGAGCQHQPTQAAYVGDVSISNEEVDEAVRTIETNIGKLGDPLPKEAWGDLRQFVVQSTMFNEVARRYAEEQGLTLPTLDYNATAARTGLPIDDPYVQLSTKVDGYRSLLLSRAQPGTPTEADLQDAYRRFQEVAGPQAATYEEVRPQLLNLREYQLGIGLREELLKAGERYGLTVNPRYQPLEMPLTVLPSGQNQLVLVALPLGASTEPPVRNI